MSNKLKELRAKEGFTIIEVIIVLVIGAVIMLAVFLVVPQLQRTQRNTRRQNDARRVLSAAEQSAANAGGVYVAAQSATAPSAETTLEGITGNLVAPNGSDYTWVYAIPALSGSATSPNLDNNSMYYTNGTATCTNNNPLAGASTGKVVVAVAVEGGGTTNTGWCVSN